MFYRIRKEILFKARQQLEDRFAKAKTIPGTHSFYHFVSISEDIIGIQKASFDKQFCTVFHFSKN